MDKFPNDVLAATTHLDPYPYYAELVSQRPFYFDDSLRLWVATSAEMVEAVLKHPACRVRPIHELVPAALADSVAGLIFGQLVRMNDGQRHCPLKQAVVETLDSLESTHMAQVSEEWAKALLTATDSSDDEGRLTDLIFRLPAYVVGSLLGVAMETLPQVAGWVNDFVRCLAPGSSPAQVEQGKQAATALFDYFKALLVSQPAIQSNGLLVVLARQTKQLGLEEPTIAIANGIGFLSQAYEATAGLIGNALLQLARQPDLRQRCMDDHDLLAQVIAEVLRYDPPVQNTRRYLAEDAMIVDKAINAGDAILLVLAAANRDPALNPAPDLFALQRENRQSYSFGTGVHVCPGQLLANTIAHTAIKQLLSTRLPWDRLAHSFQYRPSANTRIPLWSTNL